MNPPIQVKIYGCLDLNSLGNEKGLNSILKTERQQYFLTDLVGFVGEERSKMRKFCYYLSTGCQSMSKH